LLIPKERKPKEFVVPKEGKAKKVVSGGKKRKN
jgi:hypothetical protein